MSSTESWTVGRLLQWTADYLKGHGSDSPRLDAEVLLAQSLGCRRIELYTAFEQVPEEGQRSAFREMVRRRAEGMPVAYLVGRREFYSLSFRVTPDVLIPRPETELLVVTLLDLARGPPSGGPIEIADVGTGSGIIAVCAAKYISNCRVMAIDISPAALEVARENAKEHGVSERIEFLRSDLLKSVPVGKQFDFIVSNPPYVAEGEMKALAPDVRKFEPRVALLAGRKGTEVIASLLGAAAEHLRPGGHLLMEISPMIHEEVAALLATGSRYEPGPTVKDLARQPRVVQAKRK
jgi:release factor glutamine methyltransferase